MATNLGYVHKLGYIPTLGETNVLETLKWEENKWTYMAAAGAGLLITLALFKRKSKRRKAKKASRPAARRPGTFSVSYQG